MLVNKGEKDTLHEEGRGASVMHERWTVPWKVVNTPESRISGKVKIYGREIRERTVSASNVKSSHLRPPKLFHSFEDEVAERV